MRRARCPELDNALDGLQIVTMARIAQRPDRYLHAPRLSPTEGDAARLTLIAWQIAEHTEHVLALEVGPDGSLGPEQPGPACPQIVTLTRGARAEPTDDASSELREVREGQEVVVEHRTGVSSVWLLRGGGVRVLVWRARGAAAAPALMPTPDGTWVAFHHDVREDTGESDVAKWVALRFVDGAGRVFEPEAGMTGRDRDRGGVEQSFEFPALVVGVEGAVALFGRGSHNYFRQDVNEHGFGERVALSDGEWGSRGRHIVAIRVRDGIVVARRERHGIEVDLLEHVQGAAPALRDAQIEQTSPQVSASRHAVDRAGDPARAHGHVTLFGDIQQHSAHSDGLGSADEAYLRARYRYEDDFVALTDHESFLGKRTGPGEWAYLQRVAEAHDEPSAFATLVAYEWTGKAYPGPGHKCVYLPRAGLPIVSRDDVPAGDELVRQIRSLGGFASPHHIGWTGANEPGHDDRGQPVWEICSCHGCYEHVDHPLGQRGTLRDHMADAALRRGLRFGFTASSDSHGLLWHHGEARKRDPYRTGLTAVQATACTRDAVMEALVKRRCYATSGAKILLDVRADGQPMGSELRDRTRAAFHVSVVGTARLLSIELVSAAGVIAHSAPADREGSLSAVVSGAFAYARATQEDGEMAWSSPVFLGPAKNP